METRIATTEGGKKFQIGVFLNAYPNHKTLMNVPQTKMDKLLKGYNFFVFIEPENQSVQSFAEGYTGYKNLFLYGKGGGTLGAIPVFTSTMATPPPIPEANLIALFRSVVQDCGNSGNLTADIAKDLGILAPEEADTLATGTPALSAKVGQGGHVELHTPMGIYGAWEIYKNSGTGYVFLNTCMNAHFRDNSPLPALGVAVVTKYKAIFVVKNVQVGNWSSEVTVTISGHL